jgi:peptidoglycan/LPS O-acetylase OafA/YrhL
LGTTSDGTVPDARPPSWGHRLVRLYDLPGNRPRIFAMDGARGLAVLLVFFVHYDSLFSQYLSGALWSQAVSGLLGTIGHAGVEVFFALSGYLIYGIVLPRPVNYPRFLRRRVRRIYPTYLVVLGLYLLLSWLFPERSHLPRNSGDAAWSVAANILLLPGILKDHPLVVTVAWTLSYELFFYITLPAAVWLLRLRHWKPWARALLFLLSAAAYLVYCDRQGGPFAHPRLVTFLAGMLVYEALAWPWLRDSILTDKWAPIGDVLAGVALYGGIWLVYGIMALPGRPVWLHQANHQACCYAAVLSVACAVFLIQVLGGRGRLAALLSWTPLHCLGAMSYSYYLIHGLTLNACVWVLAQAMPPSAALFWATLPLALALTFVSSTLLFVFVEKPWSFPPGKGAQVAAPRRSLAAAVLVANLEGPPPAKLALENPAE